MTTTTKQPHYRLHHRLHDTRDELAAERTEAILDRLQKPIEQSRFRDLADAVLQQRNESRHEDELVNCRQAFSSAEGTNALLGLVNTAILRGQQSQVDTTRDWVARQSLPDFLSARFAHLDRSPRLETVPRGGAADHIAFRLQTESGFSLTRFGATFVIDERDLLDERTIQLQLVALEETGRAAARLVGDLVYSKILENPQMSHDSTAVFHADHSNLDDAALSSSSLQDGVAGIAGQVLIDQNGIPAHLNLTPSFLIIPPALSYAALSNARATELREPPIEVRTESRLSGTGSYDPTSETLFTGSDSNWLLAAPSTQRPSVIVAARDGVFTPRVRSFTLDRGRWGVGFDISLDLAVCVSDYRGLYWSTGTA